MSKEINSSSMDTLFQGLTGKASQQETVPAVESESQTPSPEKKKEKQSYEVISTMVDPAVISKVRTIASNEGIAIKTIIGVGLEMVIAKYEELHGTIHVKKAKKSDVRKVFNI